MFKREYNELSFYACSNGEGMLLVSRIALLSLLSPWRKDGRGKMKGGGNLIALERIECGYL